MILDSDLRPPHEPPRCFRNNNFRNLGGAIGVHQPDSNVVSTITAPLCSAKRGLISCLHVVPAAVNKRPFRRP